LAYEHCKCTDAKAIARAVAERFEDSYAVAAAIAGRLVGRGVDVESALKEAERAVVVYALDYIRKTLGGLKVRRAVRRVVPAMVAMGLLGSWPPKLTADVVAMAYEVAYRVRDVEIDEMVLKLLKANRPGSSLYKALREAVHAAACRAFYACEDALCGGSSAPPCDVVEMMEDFLYWLK